MRRRALAAARERLWAPALSSLLLLMLVPPAHAGGSPGGDTCQTATVVPSLPFFGSGSTASPATNTTSDVPAGCLAVPQAAGSITSTDGRDHIYAFSVASTTQVRVDLTTSDDDYDPQIYLLSSCGVMSTCLEGSDRRCSVNDPVSALCPGGSNEELTRTLTAGTYYLYIDSFAIGQGSSYTISVPEPGASAAAALALMTLAACARSRRPRSAGRPDA